MRQSAFILLIATTAAAACSAFLLQDRHDILVGRNYDWSVDDGLVIVNKRGMVKSAFGQDNPVAWTSRYGSVTFNQFGCEQPTDGMNEAGLVITALWLDETILPEAGALPTLTSLQWVQYQLDVSRSVAEVLARDSQVAVAPGAGSSVHFFVADSAGNTAVVEYLAGRRVHHLNPRVPALTNSRQSESESTLASLRPFGGRGDMPTDFGSLARFARAACYLRQFDPADSIPTLDYSFSLLSAVSLGMETKWSLVYDIRARRIWFRTQRNQTVRRLDLRDFDYSGATPAKILDVNARLTGGVNRHFENYRTETNRALIFRVFRRIDFLKGIPDRNLEALARYPETFRYSGEQ